MIERLTKGAVSVAILLCTVGVTPGSGSPMRTTGKRSEFRSAEMAAAYAAYTRSVAGALRTSTAIPAFARKYGLRCSACHTVWPELNVFGQRFKDNGYQLGNDRDSPIWQSNGYWPIAMRTTPHWHLESTTNQITDAAPGGKTITQAGFDLSGVDFLMLGTLHKNITFGLVPTLDPDGDGGDRSRLRPLRQSGKLALGQPEGRQVRAGQSVVRETIHLAVQQRRVPLRLPLPARRQRQHLRLRRQPDRRRVLGPLVQRLHALQRVAARRPTTASRDHTERQEHGRHGHVESGLGDGQRAGPAARRRVRLPGPPPDGVRDDRRRPDCRHRVGQQVVPPARGDGAGLAGKSGAHPAGLARTDDAALGPGPDKPTWNNALLEAHYVATPRLMVQGRYELTRMSKQGDPAIPKTFGKRRRARARLPRLSVHVQPRRHGDPRRIRDDEDDRVWRP